MGEASADGELDERSMQQVILLESTAKSRGVGGARDSSDTQGGRGENGDYQQTTKRLFNPTNGQKQAISEKFSELRAQERQPQKQSSLPDPMHLPHEEIVKTQDALRHSAADLDAKEQTEEFVLSSSPYRVNSGINAPNAVAGQNHSNDSNSISGNNAAIYSNLGYNTQSRSHHNSLSNNTTTQNQGAISSRLKNVVSPVEVKYSGMVVRQAASSKKQDTHNGTTDSDFFALTAEDGESQMDPILIMKNLSNLNSGTTSSGGGILYQENESTQRDVNRITATNHSSAPMVREKDAVILSEEQVDV